MWKKNKPIDRMASFIVMDVPERAKELQAEGIDIIHLEVGEPDFDMPGCVANATVKAQQNGVPHYTHLLGDLELRKETSLFRMFTNNSYRFVLEKAHVGITPGIDFGSRGGEICSFFICKFD